MRIAFQVVLGFAILVLPVDNADAQSAGPEERRNVVLFVADGLRANMVNDQTAPNMAKLAREGVRFINSHAMFPSFTMTNASALATGHMPGDTGVFSNTIWVRDPVQSSVTPYLEKDDVLGDLDKLGAMSGDFLHSPTLFALARAKGYQTAAIGKVGPVLLFDHSDRGAKTIVIDDWTGDKDHAGIPLSDEVTAALEAVGLSAEATARGENQNREGTKVTNTAQQDYFAVAATKAVLPLLVKKGDPFLVVFWSRDPDGTQHNQGDSPDDLVPGINGTTSLAAIRNADDDLGRIRTALDELGVSAKTDIIVLADHGFSTISKESETSPSIKARFDKFPEGSLPLGFLSFDLAAMMKADDPAMVLFDPDNGNAQAAAGAATKFGNGVIGADAAHPKLVVTTGGGTDLIYIPEVDDPGALGAAKALAAYVVTFLLTQDYVSGIFVRSDLGSPAGALPLSSILLEGDTLTPKPAIVVSFRSFDSGCGEPTRCTAEVADTILKQGHGMHGTFSRADTWNFMAAAGPSFRAGFVDTAPASNADIGRTVAHLLDLDFERTNKGRLVGRVLSEAFPGGEMPEVQSEVLVSEPAGKEDMRTVVQVQKAGGACYFDAGGFIGRTVGLSPDLFSLKTAATEPICP